MPFAVRNRDCQIGTGESVLRRYERISFDKAYCAVQGQAAAALIAPGHPLIEAVIDLVRERSMDVMKRGTIFVDENDAGADARLLFYIEDAVQDGVPLPVGGQRVISKHIHFVEIRADGSAANAGYAPYLDYRAPQPEEAEAIRAFLAGQDWLSHDVEGMARSYAVRELIPTHLKEIRERRTARIDKTIKAVTERLTAEIQYWDYRAGELREKEAAGKTNARLNAQKAAQRAEELSARMQRRLAELDMEKRIAPTAPIVVGGALVIPRGRLDTLMGCTERVTVDPVARSAVEQAAMNAVMEIERSLGYVPRDVSAEKVGYDVESEIPMHLRASGDAPLRFIEVKGRRANAATVTVTKNEILTAFNKPAEYILALVAVDGTRTRTTYLQRPFRERPDFAATSVNYDIKELMDGATVLLQR